MIPQQDKSIGIPEGKRAKKDAFNEGEDRGGRPDAKSQSKDHGQGEAGCFAQLAKCEAEILCWRVHVSTVALLTNKDGAERILESVDLDVPRSTLR